MVISTGAYGLDENTKVKIGTDPNAKPDDDDKPAAGTPDSAQAARKGCGRQVSHAAPSPSSAESQESSFWLSRMSRTIFFLVVVLSLAGIYAAFQVPISVFPETNFPRVVIAVDNGVMPVEQMQVTITKPIEDAVNSVPGLQTVRSITSRGSAEVDLFFDWNVDMFQTLQLADAALATVRQSLPASAVITTHRLSFATFPILGYALTADDRGAATIPQTRLWEIATYDLKPPLNRVDGVATVTVQGDQIPEYHVVPNLARLQNSGVTLTDLVNGIQNSNIIDSPGLYEANHELVLALVGAQAHDAAHLASLVVKTTPAGAPVRVADVATRRTRNRARLHHGDRQRSSLGPDQYHPATLFQHRAGRERRRRRSCPTAERSSAGYPPDPVL